MTEYHLKNFQDNLDIKTGVNASTVTTHKIYDIVERCDFARSLARRAGREAMTFRRQYAQDNLGIESKGQQDFVTIADKQSEDTIKAALEEQFPEDGFLGEESGGHVNDSGTWVVDPIDGTNNFIHDLRWWGVSLAFVANGRVLIGVIYDAPSDQLFWALDGHGARCNGVVLQAKTYSRTQDALAIVGSTMEVGLQAYYQLVQTLHSAGVDHRRLCATTINLAYVAKGSVDAAFEVVVSAWDALAGLLIAKEAGSQALSLPLDQFLTQPGPVVCGSNDIIKIIQSCDSKILSNLVPLNGE